MKCDELETEQWLDYGGEPMPCYPAKDVDEAIAELKARIHELESMPHTDNSAVIELLSEELRATKRALWMARALIAKHVANFCYYIAHYGKMNKVKKIYQDQDKWDKIEELCIKKAEKYK